MSAALRLPAKSTGFAVTAPRATPSMLHPIRILLVITSSLCASWLARAADSPAAPPKSKQFIYVLRLVPRLQADDAWTDEDKKAVGTHFARLKTATAEGKVILAGRTVEPGDKTFGIVVFEAADLAAARTFAESDPAVVAHVMTCEVHPFGIALLRKEAEARAGP